MSLTARAGPSDLHMAMTTRAGQDRAPPPIGNPMTTTQRRRIGLPPLGNSAPLADHAQFDCFTPNRTTDPQA
jgi:hypothetical protein